MSLRRWFRVWVRATDPERSEEMLRVFATDEHSIQKQCASEGRAMVSCYPLQETTRDTQCRDCGATIESGTEIHTDDLGDYILCRCGASQDHDPDGFREEN